MDRVDAAGAWRAPLTRWLVAIRFPCLLLILLLCGGSAPAAHAVDIVANHSVPDTLLKRSVAWAVFSMRLRTWSDGTPATVFVLSDNHPIHAEFTKTILDTFPYQLRRAWDRLVFSGTGQAPREVGSIGEMHDRIRSTPGSIGYLPSAMVEKDMKTVKVE